MRAFLQHPADAPTSSLRASSICLTEGSQSVLHPRGAAADEIAALANVLFWGGAIILAAVIAATAYALLAPRASRRWMTRDAFLVAAGIVFPVGALTALLVHAWASPALRGETAPARVSMDVYGEQWWWRVRYLRPDGTLDFETANEIRIPVREPVELRLHAADVLHSFWVPSLAGKVDMIPGRVNRLRLNARETGTFRGQCTEYCGPPHAKMALHVIADTPEAFDAWRAQQRGDAPRARGNGGLELFLQRGCGFCHTVRGTPAIGTRGPDLTHVAGRPWLGAGTLANDSAALDQWVRSAQHLKPGNLMPSFAVLPAAELDAIGLYLTTLH